MKKSTKHLNAINDDDVQSEAAAEQERINKSLEFLYFFAFYYCLFADLCGSPPSAIFIFIATMA